MPGSDSAASGPDEPLRVFVGADDSQIVAAQVLEFSIRRHASRPVRVTVMKDLPVPLPRDRRNRPQTGFSFYRFLIPRLCGRQGRALYLDADMLVFADLAELWTIPFGRNKVLCTYQSEAPAAWKGTSFVKLGRNFSVMLLDCPRLDWDIEHIVRGLDQGRYTYAELIAELCIVCPDEIAEAIPPDWNRLEAFEEDKTKLLHYTIVATQPWASVENPLRDVWLTAYRDALRAGAVDPADVVRGIEAGLLHSSLADDLPLSRDYRTRPAGAAGDGRDGSASGPELTRLRDELGDARRRLRASEERVADLEETIASLRASWTWQLGRLVTAPLGRLRRLRRRR
jgi:Glycosyl transferase family 8